MVIKLTVIRKTKSPNEYELRYEKSWIWKKQASGYRPMNLKILLAVCLTVDAGCIKYRLKTEKYRGQRGSRNTGAMCYNQPIHHQY